MLHAFGVAGQFAFSFTADREMMPDPTFYARCLQESLDELLATAPAPADITTARDPPKAKRVANAGQGRAASRSAPRSPASRRR